MIFFMVLYFTFYFFLSYSSLLCVVYRISINISILVSAMTKDTHYRLENALKVIFLYNLTTFLSRNIAGDLLLIGT